MSADATPEAPEIPEDDQEMSFLEHLGELRTRLIRALLGVLPPVAVAWLFKEQLMDVAVRPLTLARAEMGLSAPTLHFADPTGAFIGYLKVALVSGALAAAPWLFWQAWAFVSPGLYRRERRLAIPFVAASTLCFFGGVAFCYAVVFPMILQTLLGFQGQLASGARIEDTLFLGEYLTFSVRLLGGFGIVFEVPVIVVFLGATGAVDARRLMRFGRWWIVIAAVLGAILTPPDVGSQMLMLLPLVGLYYLSVGIVAFLDWRRSRSRD